VGTRTLPRLRIHAEYYGQFGLQRRKASVPKSCLIYPRQRHLSQRVKQGPAQAPRWIPPPEGIKRRFFFFLKTKERIQSYRDSAGLVQGTNKTPSPRRIRDVTNRALAWSDPYLYPYAYPHPHENGTSTPQDTNQTSCWRSNLIKLEKLDYSVWENRVSNFDSFRIELRNDLNIKIWKSKYIWSMEKRSKNIKDPTHVLTTNFDILKKPECLIYQTGISNFYSDKMVNISK
jgi:hypothetical protein